MLTLNAILALSLVMFMIGLVGVVVRKNLIVVFMCIELMLNAVNLAFAGFSMHVGNLDGQIGVFFVMVVAAAEAAVGLGIIISVFRNQQTIESTKVSQLKG